MKFLDRFKFRKSRLECDHQKTNKIIIASEGDNYCHKKAKYVWYECTHPASKEYNQHDGEYGAQDNSQYDF